MVESFVYATSHCTKVRSRNPRRSRKNWKPPPLHIAERCRLNSNLNPNRVYRPACTRTMRTYACGQQGQTAAAKRRIANRASRTQPPCAHTLWAALPQACQFADVLYYAFLHTRVRGSSIVQSQLARGCRYTLLPTGYNVLLESPRANICYRTCASLEEVLAALPGACRAGSRCEQRQIQSAIAHWLLGPERAREALENINKELAREVPLDTALEKCCELEREQKN